MSSIIVYLVILVAGGTLAEISTPAERYKAWVAENQNWKKAVGAWKKAVEAKCNVSDADQYWREAFTCPDISNVTCQNDDAHEIDVDSLGCSSTVCTDGSYSDQMALLDMWRHHFNAHEMMMSIWRNKLIECTCGERKADCLNSDAATLEAWNSHSLKYSELSIALLEAKGEITKLQNKSDDMTALTENYADLSSAVMEADKLLAKLENQSKVWNELSETSTELTSGLMEANKKIDHLENKTAELDSLSETQSELLNSMLEAKEQIQTLENENTDKTKKYTELSNSLVEMNEQHLEATETQAQQYTELSHSINDTNALIMQVQAETSNYCPMTYNHKCFWIEYREEMFGFEEGQQICSEKGGKSANVYSERHYYLILGHLAMASSVDVTNSAWCGMTYDTETDTLLLTDGTPAPFEKWRMQFPKSEYNEHIYVEARKDWTTRYQHMANAITGEEHGAVICEK